MDLDLTIPNNPIYKRDLTPDLQWGPEQIVRYKKTRFQDNYQDLIAKITSGQDLQIENIEALLISRQNKINKQLEGSSDNTSEAKNEIKAELPPDIIIIDEEFSIDVDDDIFDIANKDFDIAKKEIDAEPPSDVIVIDDSDDEDTSDDFVQDERTKTEDSGLGSICSSSIHLHEEDFKSELTFETDLNLTDSNVRPKHQHTMAILQDNNLATAEFWKSPELQIDEVYLIAANAKNPNRWSPGRLLRILSDTQFKFLDLRTKQIVKVDPKSIAFKDGSDQYYKVGTRVIAGFRKIAETGEVRHGKGIFRLGVVAEYPGPENNSRYLIIFDNGYWLYVRPENVRPLYYSRKHVWKDVPVDMKKTVKSYLRNYYTPLIDFTIGQLISVVDKSEKSRGMHFSNVIAIDSSLVLVLYRTTKKIEWVHRGSPKLKTIDNGS